jgi:aspartate racemase
MEEQFYRSVLEDTFGLRVVVPAADDSRLVDKVIFDELCRGVIADNSRQEYLRIVDSLAAQGCGAIILGCTEIALLIGSGDTDLKLYDTTEIHAQQAVAMMLDQ